MHTGRKVQEGYLYKLLLNNFKAFEEVRKCNSQDQRNQQASNEPAPCKGLLYLGIIILVEIFHGNAPCDQADEQQHHRKIQESKHLREDQRECSKSSTCSQDEPYLIPAPERPTDLWICILCTLSVAIKGTKRPAPRENESTMK